jgi:hypothetical protein
MIDHDSADGKPKVGVGYGRPPVNRQFRPGQSGNPKGRPKGQKNLVTMFAETLNEKIPVRGRNGKRRRLTKLQAMFEVITNKALSGDAKAFSTIVQLAERYGVFKYQEENSSAVLASLREKIAERFERLARPLPPEIKNALARSRSDAAAPDSADATAPDSEKEK